MIRQFWRRAICVAASGGALWFLALPAAAQIPVIDPAAIAKQIEQIAELRTQIETAKDQLTQLQSLHGSLNKLTNMGDIAALLSNPAVRQALPKDFGQLEAALKGQGAGALGSRAETYARENEVYARTGDDFYATESRRAQLANAGQTSLAQQVYEAASRRRDGLDELRRQIGQSEDPKTTRDLQFAQQDAQTEVTDLTNELQGIFQEKLNPIIEQVRIDKGLQVIFSVRDAGIVAVEPGLDLSAEVIKRFDAAAKTAPKK